MGEIVITTSSFGKHDRRPLIFLETEGHEIILNPFGRTLKKEEVIDLCKDAVGIIAGTETLDDEVLRNLTHLKVISRCGTGMDNIDIDSVKRLGIQVYNTPDSPTRAVAELTVGLILNLLRKVTQMDVAVRKGKWDKLMGNLLYEKKVGIIGFGRIGQRVGEILSVFGAELSYYDAETKYCSFPCSEKKFEEILSWADIITLHLSHPPGGKAVIGSRELDLMKKGSWLVNVSRGHALDAGSLYQSLKNGHIAGAALDVFEQEPYSGSLRELENVILTPHIGSYTKEARAGMEMEAVKNLLEGLKDNE